MKYNVFISYSRKDTEIIDRIEQELLRYGITCFIDRSAINPGEDYAEVISKALYDSDLMLFVWSENSNQSREAANEVALAIEFEKQVVPFKIGEFKPDFRLAYRLVRFNRIDAVAFNEQKIVALGEKIAAQLGKTLSDGEAQSKVAAVQPVASAVEEVVEDPVIEEAYREALDLICQYKIREAFDAIYPLAIIGYKDSFDRLVFFTGKKFEKYGHLSEEQIERIRTDADNGIDVARYIYSRYLLSISEGDAFRYAQEAVDNGFVPAKLALAKCYDLGVGVAQDNDMCSRLMIEAKDAGDLAAELEYIRYVCNGFNFKQDEKRALRMWEALANKGVAAAMSYIADFYTETIHWDVEKALYYSDMAIERGYKECYYTKALAYGYDKHFNLIDSAKYVENLNEGAMYNDISSMVALAYAYYDGVGRQKNLKHAVRWAKRAAELGSTSAMLLLNQIYYFGGEGVEVNDEEAWRWAKRGAARNHYASYIALGNMCRDGYGMEDSLCKDCVTYYERAVYLGGSSADMAALELYKIYSEGKFEQPRDMEKAISYLKPIAGVNNGTASLLYGKLLVDAESDYCNEVLGVKYLNIACEAGVAEAYYCLGKLYEEGFGVMQDDAKAEELFAKAAELGYEVKD